MSNDFLDKPRGRWRLIAVGAAAAVVLIGLGAVIYRVVDDGQTEKPAVEATPSSTPGEVLGVDPDDLGSLTVTPGRELVEGVSVGYPHTIPGAVSAAAEYFAQYGSNLDVDRGRAIARIVTDPSLPEETDELANAPGKFREHLGYDATGPVPPGVAVTVAPVSYQLREPSDDQITVLLLFYATVQTPANGTKSSIGVIPFQMRWVADDWKFGESINGDPYLTLAATPNTADAIAAGWKGLTR